MGKDDAYQSNLPILTPSQLKQSVINLGRSLFPRPDFGIPLGSATGRGFPIHGKTILVGSGVVFGNGTYLGGYWNHVHPAPTPVNDVPPPPENKRPVVDTTPTPPGLACYDSSRSLSESQWQEIASRLGVEVALIKAIAHCESDGVGFNSSGRPKIRIEASWLRKFGIEPPFKLFSNSWEDFEKLLKKGQSQSQEKKYEIALIASTSFGIFQVMGVAYLDFGTRVESDSKWGGWKKKDDTLSPRNPEKALDLLRRFKDAMMCNEYNQAEYFVKVVQGKRPLLRAMQQLEFNPVTLRPHDWCTIARLYNGPDFVKNHPKKGGYDMALIDYYLDFGGTKSKSAREYRDKFEGKKRPCQR